MSIPLSPVPLPTEGKQYLRVVWPRAGQTLRAYCLSPRVVGALIHWNPRTERSQLCVKPHIPCVWCADQMPTKWYGFVFGHSLDFSCPCLVQLTETCVRKTLGLRDAAQDLRGCLLTLSRPASKFNAPMACVIQREAIRISPAEQPPDVLQHLARFYGVRLTLAEQPPQEEGGAA